MTTNRAQASPPAKLLVALQDDRLWSAVALPWRSPSQEVGTSLGRPRCVGGSARVLGRLGSDARPCL